MPVTRLRSKLEVQKILRRAAVEASIKAMEQLAGGYFKEVTKNTADSHGSCDAGGRSCPGEFPYVETGRGANNIKLGAKDNVPRVPVRVGVTGRVGRDGGSWHLHLLTRPGVDRLGLFRAFRMYYKKMRRAYGREAKKVKRVR